MKTEEHTMIEVLEFVQQNGLANLAEVVGRWVWLTFPDKPEATIRESLRAFGFRWIPRRGRWAHNCGHPCRAGVGDPRHKYPVYSVDQMRQEDLQVA